MYQKILVPLDASELAEVALPYAEELAERLGGEMTLLHVCDSEDDPNRHAHEIYVEKMAESMSEKGLRAKPALLFGHVAEQIVDYADSEDAGLIVMATHGRSGIRRWVLGDVAAKVVRATRRPVALIRAETGPPKPRDGILRKILVPLDGSKVAESVLPHVEALAKQKGLNGIEVVLLQVSEPPEIQSDYPASMPITWEDHVKEETARRKRGAEQYLAGVEKKLKDAGLKARSEALVGKPAQEITDYCSKDGFSLIVMATHGRSGLSRWAFGSIAEKVLLGTTSPIIVIRPH